MNEKATADLSARLAELRATLGRAATEAHALFDDPLLLRVVDAYHSLPAEDRSVIVGVLEREAMARRVTEAVGTLTAQAVRPNPNARLYVRLHGHEPRPEALDRDELVLTTLRMMHVLAVLFEPEVFPVWRSAVAEALVLAEPEDRARYQRCCQVVLDLIDENLRAEARGELCLHE